MKGVFIYQRLYLFFPVLKAILLSCSVIVAINFIGSLTSKDRLLSIVSEANKEHQLDQLSNTDNDMFTECAMFYMDIDRHESKIANIFSTKFDISKPHPCDGLRFLLDGNKNYEISNLENNTRYFYGSRHLFSMLANYLSIDQIRSIYFILSIFSPLLLWTAFLIESRSNFIIISPLIISMLIGFDLGNMGGNIAHSPGFFLPIICLAGVILWPNSLVDLRKRVFAYAVIASMTTYFDTIHGPLPFILSVTIIINHMLYHPVKFASANNREWILEVVGLIALFSSVFVLLIILKLIGAIPFVKYNVFLEFYKGLSYRLSSNIASSGSALNLITHAQVWERLWFYRAIYFYHSVIAATSYYLFAGVAWVLVLITVLYHRMFRIALPCWREIVVLVIVSMGIIVWYFEFVNHTYIHAQFMGRLGIIPASAGAMALIYLGRCRWNVYIYKVGWTVGVAIAPLVAVLIILYPPLTISDIHVDHNSKIDAVSCSNSSLLTPDRVPDVNLKFKVANVSNFFNFRASSIRLERNVPVGAFSTNLGSFPLGVLDDELKVSNNDRSGSFLLRLTNRDINVVMCADGGDTTDSKYRLVIDTNYGILKSDFFDL